MPLYGERGYGEGSYGVDESIIPLNHLITITNDGTARTYYEFTVYGWGLEKDGDAGSINPSDEISGMTATGWVNNGVDAYNYGGVIVDFSYTGPVPTVTIDGDEVDPDKIGTVVNWAPYGFTFDIEYVSDNVDFVNGNSG